MDTEQEGINLEAVNLNEDDSINLPDVKANDDAGENNTSETNTVPTVKVDEEKESLKKGINAERKARKEAEKKAKELELRIAALEQAGKSQEKTTLDELIANGVEENIAKSIASAIDKKQEGSKKFEQELSDMKLKYELSEKSKDSNFADIMDYEEDIRDLTNKGLSIEQAYYALSYNNPSINTRSEIEKEVEVKLQNNQARKEILGNVGSNAGGVSVTNNNKPKATANEIAMAKLAGMDINDYLAAKEASSIKQYDNYQKKKIK